MANYTYINSGGAPATVTAPTPTAAIATAPNIDPHSGVQDQTAPGAVKPADSSNPPSGPTPLRYTGTGNSGPSGPTYVGEDGNTYYQSTNTKVPDSQTRVDALNSIQAGVDSINQSTIQALNTQKAANQTGPVAVAKAENARNGLTGSDFGNANTQNASQKGLSTIMANGQKQIQAITTSIDKDMQAKITAGDKLTAEDNKTLATNTDAYIKDLAKTGVSLDSLTQDQYNHIIETSGKSEAEVRAEYAANVPASKTLHSEVRGNQLIQVVQGADGSTHTNIIPITGVPDSYTYNSSIQAFVPKDGIDPNKPISSQVIPYAKATASSKAGSTSSTKDLDAAVSDIKDAQTAVAKGADAIKVRERFIETHPKDAALYDKYFTNPKYTQDASSTNPF